VNPPSIDFPQFNASRIHIMGAPGSGITTMGQCLAEQLGVVHFDTDNYHWITSDPESYRRRRNPDHRRQLLSADLSSTPQWILTGSLCGWGDVFAPLFDTVIFCTAPIEIRMERIRLREISRYGEARLLPGGNLNGVYLKFLQWVSEYDLPSERLRTFAFEMNWVKKMCHVPVWLNDNGVWQLQSPEM
jgi:adenylate kinase family enzyme